MRFKVGENIIIKSDVYNNIEGIIIDYFNEDGIKKYGADFWKGYPQQCELGYFVFTRDWLFYLMLEEVSAIW